MQPNIDAQAAELSQATKTAGTAISAIETVKCCNGQDYEVEHFSNAIGRAAEFYRRQARANALQIGFVRLIILCMFVQGFWYGSSLLGSGGRDAGQILTTFWATLMATQTAEQILPQLIVLEKGKAAGAALKVVVQDENRTMKASAVTGGKRRSECKGDIKFKHVGAPP
jgi:ATP-binding cassette subfamily B (MDR/TAP) protein 1